MPVITESFEGLTEGANSPAFFIGALSVGRLSAFRLASGVSLISPVPNNSSAPAFVADFALGFSGAPLRPGGPLDAASVASGSAFFHSNGWSPGFAFETPVYTVGFKGISDDIVGLAAFEASGKLITASAIRSVGAGDWDTNYVQVISKVPITSIVVHGEIPILDDLTFDTSKPSVVKGTGGDDFLNASAPRDASPSNNAEFIFGKGGNDKIKAKGGDDTIDAGNGRDKVQGGDGNDTITGGDGADKLKGGAGQDSFVMGALGSVDKLKDFDPFDDTIVLPRTTFGGLSKLADFVIKTELRIGSASADTDDRIIYDFNTGALSYDVDGNGPIAPIKFAKLPLGLALTGSDFLLV